MRTATVRRNHAVVAYRLQPGYEPSSHDCRYTQGLLTQVPVLFDLPPARLRHTACQVDGAAECRYEVAWRARRHWWTRPLRRRGTTAERNAAVLRGHVVDLERSVADLVSARDVEEVLRGVAEVLRGVAERASWRTGEPHPVRCAELFRGLDSLAEQAAVALGNIRLLATIRHQATHDTLTGLAGRSLLLDRATQALASAERTGAVTGYVADGAMYLAKVAGTPRLGAPAGSARR